MSLPKPIWSDMTWPEIHAADTSSWIAVLPVAAVEQHGPHLPLSTDVDIMEGYLAHTRAILPADLPVTILPTQSVGLSPEHVAFPGTLTLSAETAMRSWNEIGDSLARAGIRKLVLVSSHGGNNALIDIVARDLRVRHGMLAVTTAWARFGYPDGLFTAEEIAHGVHGGEIETSLMLAFHPNLVRRDSLKNFVPASIAIEKDYRHLRASRPAGFGWLAQDLNPEGALGNAAAATAEKGEAAAEFGARALIELFQDIDRVPPDFLKNGPLS